MAVEQNDARLAQFEGNTVLLSIGQSLLTAIDELNEFNSHYLTDKSDEDSEYGTFWKQYNFTKSLADEAPDGTPTETVKKAQQLIKAANSANERLQKAREEAVAFAAETLGIEKATKVEKPDRDNPEVKRLQENVRAPAVDLARNAKQLADGIGLVDEAQKNTILEFLKKYPIPQVARDGKLDVTEDKTSAPRYRVDVTAIRDGEVQWTEKGFTKAALKTKDKPDAKQFRKVYEDNKGPDGNVVEFTHEGTTYRLAKRES